jgi:hypothetical protein
MGNFPLQTKWEKPPRSPDRTWVSKRQVGIQTGVWIVGPTNAKFPLTALFVLVNFDLYSTNQGFFLGGSYSI